MSDIKAVVLMSCLVKAVFIGCVTYSAIHFQNYNLLWWYLLASLIGYECKHRDKEKGNDDE